MLIPGKPVPELEVDLTDGVEWRLANAAPESFTLVNFYRGLHCPICRRQLEAIAAQMDKFEGRGVKVVAVSMDSEERADKTAAEWSVGGVPIGYGLTRKKAEEWGLYISKGFQESEPEIFSEPGMFLVRPNGELFAAWVQSVPFARPDTDDLLSGIAFVLDKDYPARGTEVPS